MKEKDLIPSTDFVGKIKINGIEIPCAVLYPDTNPTSVIVQREIVGLLTGNKKGGFERYYHVLKGVAAPFLHVQRYSVLNLLPNFMI